MTQSAQAPKESTCTINISEDEVLRLLKNLKTSKGAGSDGIPPVFLNKCAATLAKPLTIILNYSIKYVFCNFPKIWKEALIVHIHKSGSKAQIENYRDLFQYSML